VVVGQTRPDLHYEWTKISAPDAVGFLGMDSSLFSISTPATSRKEWVVFRVECRNDNGCRSASVKDSIYTIPFECSLYSEPSVPAAGQPMQVKVNSNQNPWQVSEWTVGNAEILDKSPVSLRLVPEGVNPEVKAEILVLDPRDGVLCKAIRTLSPGIQNLILGTGTQENQVLSFGGKPLEFLRIFNRWGQKVADFGKGYLNQWPDSKVATGVYYYEAGLPAPSETLRGWVELR
jgi:hypothetical protein